MDLNPIFEQANIGIILVDQNGIISRANEYAKKLLEYKAEELDGMSLETLLPQRVRKKHVGHRHSYFEAPSPRVMGAGRDLFALSKSGQEIPIEISLSHFISPDGPRVAAFISDISIRKKAEVDLRNSEEKLQRVNSDLENRVKERTSDLAEALLELQEANATLEEQIERTATAESEARKALVKEQELSELKSRFVSMASHEFRTPLTSILSSASLIGKYIQAEKPEKTDKHLKRITNSVRNLTGILNDFLSLEKLRSGKIQVVTEPSDLSLVCEEVVEEMQVILKTGQFVDYQHTGDRKEVLVDPHAFRNVITNLLSNAVKYSHENQKIILQSELKSDSFNIRIQDEGIGIPEKDQERLFSRFFRAKNALNITGTGLGLHLVSHYLQLMGGEISFKSTENVGTTFNLKIPIEVNK